MKSAVLVTGAGGFIGKHLVAGLKAKGIEVRTHSSKDGDIADCQLFHDGVEHVFHLAGLSFVPASWQQPARFFRTNALGTLNVLEFCRSRGASLTYVSSYVYGQPEYLPIPESHRRSAANPYALSKIMAEDACFFYEKKFGIRLSVIRPFNIYGPQQDSRFLVSTVTEQALRPGGDVIVVADTRPKRDFLYVSDLVRLLLLTLEIRPSGAYNAGSGVATSVEELVKVVTSFTGERKLESRGELRDHEILEVRADIEKARRDLGWQPTISLNQGIQEVVASLQTPQLL